MNKDERSILKTTCYGHFLSHFNMLVFPAVLLPLSDRLQLSMEVTLGLSFWMYLLFGISALPWGILGDRLGAKRLLALFYGGAAISCTAAALTIDNPLYLSMALAAIGFFSGIYHPVGLGWIAREIQQTSLGMAYNGMFGNLGLAVAPFSAGLVNYFFGVEAVYFFVASVNFTGLLLLRKAKENRAVQSVDSGKRQEGKTDSITPFIILLLAMMLGGIVYRGISVTLPAYLELSNEHLFGWLKQLLGSFATPNISATLITSFIYLLGMLGQYCGGRVGAAYDLRYGYLVFHIITIPAAIGIALTSDIPLVLFALIHSFFLLGMQPIENTLVSKMTPEKLFSSAYGLKFILTFGVGALAVKMVETIKATFGFSMVFLTFAAISIGLVGAIAVLIRATAHRLPGSSRS